MAIPKSLGNIYREMESDLGLPIPKTGYLLPWAKNGVLLLNAVLTVEAHKGRFPPEIPLGAVHGSGD